jgi:hypothetical protein
MMLLCFGARCWMTTKAMLFSGGMWSKSPSRASSPPAEAPMPTTGKVAGRARGFRAVFTGAFLEVSWAAFLAGLAAFVTAFVTALFAGFVAFVEVFGPFLAMKTHRYPRVDTRLSYNKLYQEIEDHGNRSSIDSFLRIMPFGGMSALVPRTSPFCSHREGRRLVRRGGTR